MEHQVDLELGQDPFEQASVQDRAEELSLDLSGQRRVEWREIMENLPRAASVAA